MGIEEAEKLIRWYTENKRELPWRDTGNAYDVWLSEIMLQQTRIEAVREKFIAFKQAIPDIQTLAFLDHDALMRLWEGLGYYSRAANLQKCAKVLVEKYNGKLPEEYEQLVKLPGIGPYTAGAIASIAYGKGVSAIDGNVMRVLARYFGIKEDVREPSTKDLVLQSIQDVYKESLSYGSFNQGLMELGEILCIPKGKVLCESCPLHENCYAYKNQCVDSIPYRSPLKQKKIVERTLLVVRQGDRFLLHKRPPKGLLANLYEFMGVEKHLDVQEALKAVEEMGMEPLHIQRLPDAKHVFTHLEWHMKAYEIQVGDLMEKNDFLFANKKELAGMAIPSAFKTYVDWFSLREK